MDFKDKEMFTQIFTEVWKILTVSLFEISGQKVSLLSLLMACGIFYFSTLLSRWAERGVAKVLAEKKDLDRGVKDSIGTFTRYTVLIIGGFVTLDTVGISMNSLAAVGAVLMVGIGFGLQNITQNFISGIIILLERPIKVGDLIKVGSIRGKVTEIGARSTLVTTRDDISIIVPNSQFISEQVVNESLSGEKIRLAVNVGVAYGTDPRKVEEILMKVAKESTKVLEYPAPKVFFKDFGASSLDFSLTVWISDLWVDEGILSDMRFKICDAFRLEEIEIPFQQIDLKIKNFDQTPSHLFKG
ncbi:MAG: transporter [Halobacteriovoraceae bacterium]|nr:transporter [Halobacteriovoraceae bacterium]|tara:strand:+ start:73301 stop:74200 length:900 start_codon:yes stop_codon:yes gene_type:complete